MKKYLILSLVLVMSLSSAVFANEKYLKDIGVEVEVPPYVAFKLDDSLFLKLNPGEVQGKASMEGAIIANFPYSMSIVSKGMSNDANTDIGVNEWFLFEGYLGTPKNYFGGHPGFSASLNGNIGEQNFSLTVKMNEQISKEWYELPADTYKSTVRITISVP